MPQKLPNIKDDEIAILKDEMANDPLSLGYAQVNAAGKAKLLSQRLMVNNPNEPAQIPRTLVMLEVFAVLSDQAKQYLLGLSVTDQKTIAKDFENQDRAAVKNWGFFKTAANIFTADDATAINNYCDGTIADPKHPAQILGPSRLTALLNRDVGGISDAEVTVILAS